VIAISALRASGVVLEEPEQFVALDVLEVNLLVHPLPLEPLLDSSNLTHGQARLFRNLFHRESELLGLAEKLGSLLGLLRLGAFCRIKTLCTRGLPAILAIGTPLKPLHGRLVGTTTARSVLAQPPAYLAPAQLRLVLRERDDLYL
jgi:hypothetical protein